MQINNSYSNSVIAKKAVQEGVIKLNSPNLEPARDSVHFSGKPKDSQIKNFFKLLIAKPIYAFYKESIVSDLRKTPIGKRIGKEEKQSLMLMRKLGDHNSLISVFASKKTKNDEVVKVAAEQLNKLLESKKKAGKIEDLKDISSNLKVALSLAKDEISQSRVNLIKNTIKEAFPYEVIDTPIQTASTNKQRFAEIMAQTSFLEPAGKLTNANKLPEEIKPQIQKAEPIVVQAKEYAKASHGLTMDNLNELANAAKEKYGKKATFATIIEDYNKSTGNTHKNIDKTNYQQIMEFLKPVVKE